MPSPSTTRLLPDDDPVPSADENTTNTHQSSDVLQAEDVNERNRAGISRQQDMAVLAPIASDNIAQAWLTAQCDMIAGTMRGMVLDFADQADETKTLACWPLNSDQVPQALLDTARSALREQTFVIVSSDDVEDADTISGPISCFVASPLQPNGSTGPVAVFELPDSIRHQQQAIIQLLQWGSVWFALLRREHHPATSKGRLSTVVELLASSLEHPEFEATAITAVTELATHLACTRVSLGLVHNRSVRVCAISNSARLDTRSNLTRDIGAAMDEAVDQDATLAWPLLTGDLPRVSFAQEVLARRGGGAAVLSTPLFDGTNAIGAITLERDGEEGFDQESKDICETLATLLGPVVALKHERERALVFKVTESLRHFVGRLFGRKQIALKLYALTLLATVLFLSVATGDYRITAHARLEGSIKRVVTAPRDGFVANANYRAGDIVQAGDLLASLDDRELQLEQLKLNSQREQLEKEHRAAATSHDRSTAAIVNARKKQAGAQLALITEQLARTQLTAPFAGIVVSGDLSQSIGSPVENGQVLFEIAPLDAYRVVLEVDERDIGDIIDAQRGVLTLTGLPNATLAFTVNRIVPISTARDGRNFFEVQAELDAPTASIRPGMEGIGKVLVDQRKLIWVWTHELIDWLRLSFWAWMH